MSEKSLLHTLEYPLSSETRRMLGEELATRLSDFFEGLEDCVIQIGDEEIRPDEVFLIMLFLRRKEKRTSAESLGTDQGKA